MWDAIQSHHDLQANKAVYGEFKKNITSLAKSHPDILHVQIKNGDPYKALNAPVTAFTTITLKPGESKELLEEKVREVTEAGNSIPASWGSYGIVSGPIIEKEATYALIIGWDSAEVSAASKSHRVLFTDQFSRLIGRRSRLFQSLSIPSLRLEGSRTSALPTLLWWNTRDRIDSQARACELQMRSRILIGVEYSVSLSLSRRVPL